MLPRSTQTISRHEMFTAEDRILSRFATIATRRGCAQRWFYWYTGDPTGMASFVTPEELVTSSGVDVREFGTGEQWYEAQPD